MARFLKHRDTRIGNLFVPLPLDFINSKLDKAGKEVANARASVSGEGGDSLNYINFSKSDTTLASNYYAKINEGLNKAAEALNPEHLDFNNYNTKIAEASNAIMQVKKLKQAPKIQGTPEYQVEQNYKDYNKRMEDIKKDKVISSEEKKWQIDNLNKEYLSHNGVMDNRGNLYGYGDYNSPTKYNMSTFYSQMDKIKANQTSWSSYGDLSKEWLITSSGTNKERTYDKLLFGGIDIARNNPEMQDRMLYRVKLKYNYNINHAASDEEKNAFRKQLDKEVYSIKTGGVDMNAIQKYRDAHNGKISMAEYKKDIMYDTEMGSTISDYASSLKFKDTTSHQSARYNTTFDQGTHRPKSNVDLVYPNNNNTQNIKVSFDNAELTSNYNELMNTKNFDATKGEGLVLQADSYASRIGFKKFDETATEFSKDFPDKTKKVSKKLGITKEDAAKVILATGDFKGTDMYPYYRAGWAGQVGAVAASTYIVPQAVISGTLGMILGATQIDKVNKAIKNEYTSFNKARKWSSKLNKSVQGGYDPIYSHSTVNKMQDLIPIASYDKGSSFNKAISSYKEGLPSTYVDIHGIKHTKDKLAEINVAYGKGGVYMVGVEKAEAGKDSKPFEISPANKASEHMIISTYNTLLPRVVTNKDGYYNIDENNLNSTEKTSLNTSAKLVTYNTRANDANFNKLLENKITRPIEIHVGNATMKFRKVERNNNFYIVPEGATNDTHGYTNNEFAEFLGKKDMLNYYIKNKTPNQ